MTSRQLSTLLLLAAIWGGSFLYVRVLVDAGMAPSGVAALRTSIGAVVLLPFLVAARRSIPRDAHTWLWMLGLGALNFAAPWLLVAMSQERIPSGVAAIVNSAMPFWAAIFAVMLTRGEPLRRRQVAGLIVGFLGVVALLGEGLASLRTDAMLGIGFMLLGTACAGLSSVIIRRWLGHVAPIPLTVGQLGFASAMLLPFAFAQGAYRDVETGAGEIASALALGALGSGLAVVLYMWLISQVGAVRSTVVTYIIPPIGVFLGWAVLDEPIGWNLVAGLGLVAVGVALVQGVFTAGLGRRMGVIYRRRGAPGTVAGK